MDRNIRIPIDLSADDKSITVNIEQEFDNLEVLSLKITSSDAYTRQCSDFGVIVGRVMLNSGFGVQNAKVSIFVPITEEDKAKTEIFELYPFETVNDTFPNGVRYNLLPRIRNEKNPSHRAVGNYPDQTDFTHYPQYLEIMDKYYKYTTTTNEAGDYMIFGVPLGQKDIVMDFDVFDTNSFDISANDLVEQVSLNGSIDELKTLINSNAAETSADIANNRFKVPGFFYLGKNNFEVDVKSNLDEMPNIFHEVKQVTVSPFWGDDNFCDVGITRCDFKVNFKYTPTAIFFGFIQTPSGGFTINSDYSYPTKINTLEIAAIDSTTNIWSGDLYPYQEMKVVIYRLDDKLNLGSRVRLGVFSGSFYSGVFRISLPMYMDYYSTNEFGDLVKVNDTSIGVPTKGYYAFEIYDANEAWSGVRVASGDFNNPIVPGIRIPSSNIGDDYLGGWEGTWGGLFEYDLINRKRKFYTVKTLHKKHTLADATIPGDTIGYFPNFNPNKKDAFWNFPLTQESVKNYSDPEIIGSVLIPRIATKVSISNNKLISFAAPNILLNAGWFKSPDETKNVWINTWEQYLGIGVKIEGGVNSGEVFANLFSADDFYDINGKNIFGEIPTWNFGDNSKTIIDPGLYALSLTSKPESNANSFGVHKAFNQVMSPTATYGVFISAKDTITSKSFMEISIYDITNELPDLIKYGIYSSYQKKDANLSNGVLTIENVLTPQVGEQSEIYVVDNGIITTSNGEQINTINDPNSFNGKFYYHCMI